MDRLKREGNPPVGQLASPVPQYKDVGTEDWEIVQGEAGASYVKDRDVLAKLIEVQSELALVKAELQEIKANQLSGDQKVQLSGTNVEVLASYSETVGAGAFGSSIVITFAGGPYTGFVVGGASNDPPHDFTIEVARMTLGNKYLESLSAGDASLKVTNGIRGVSQVHRLIAPKIHFRLQNKSDVDHVYDWFILGIRGA